MMSSGGTQEVVKILAGCVIFIGLCDYFLLGGDLSDTIVQAVRDLF